MKEHIGKTGRRLGTLPSRNGEQGTILITGGAGFIGTNLAHRLLRDGHKVLLLDNFSRRGVRRNVDWLLRLYPDKVRIEVTDVRDADAVLKAVKNSVAVFHFAAQVAVTSSLSEPMNDFQINAGGTLNVLEALRAVQDSPPLVFTSTNKVYGSLENVPLVERQSRYSPADNMLEARGVNEQQALDFRSAYGCSKGSADQYVVDYSRSFGLRTVVMRMSCIYGPHQCGTEDQGWVSHVVASVLNGQSLTIYGDGKQVRDLLFIEDLIDGFLLAVRNIDRLSGQTFNIGGGPANTSSLLELVNLVADLAGGPPGIRYSSWRAGDQKYYVSDTSKFCAATGWKPRVDVRSGVERLYRWFEEQLHPDQSGFPRTAAEQGQ
jgi:CDP-paratose 2-epimerase